MPKQTLPMPTAGGGVLKKLLGAAVAIALLVILMQYPTDAASWAKSAIEMAEDLVHGIVTFIRQVA